MKCAHCGDSCKNNELQENSLVFCCQGCKTVYQLLQEHNLCDYYERNETPGITIRRDVYNDKFELLDEPEIRSKYVLFEDSERIKVKFTLPQIHCSSCIWLLEHLSRLNGNVISSEVNFTRKEVLITSKKPTSLKDLASLLSSIGYEPRISHSEAVKEIESLEKKELLLKIGVAGFCFGNIMLFAFPEYLGLTERNFSVFFGWLSLVLTIPVVAFAGVDYLKSAFKSVSQRYVNIDLPIALGIITLFGRSSYEIISQTGSGYFDSLSGLIFFLLLGKWFQEKTYDSLSFERNYKSYFPLSVLVKREGHYETTKIEDLKIGDTVKLRNQEIIPADGILISEQASIDYSFVTGESDVLEILKNNKIYAGGKLFGKETLLVLTHLPDNSYLTQLWNKASILVKKDIGSIADRVSKYFTIVILLITLGTLVGWYLIDTSKIWISVTSVLIVACPCALALTIPFTLGNAIRFLGRKRIYLKNAQVLEKLSKVNHIVFDKTGTITQAQSRNIQFNSIGKSLDEIGSYVKALTTNSSHPLSKALTAFLNDQPMLPCESFREEPGNGLFGNVKGRSYFVGKIRAAEIGNSADGSQIGIYEDELFIGSFSVYASVRNGLEKTIETLKNRHVDLSLISGDSDREDHDLATKIPISDRHYHFGPMDKMEFISKLQSQGKTVAMIGDGLNDSGALIQSDVGIAISDDVNYFVPACDIIMDGNSLPLLDALSKYSQISMRIIWGGFALSFFYNIIGLSFAVSGTLSPIIAAVLMPLSSISIVAFASFTTRYFYKRLFL